MNSLDNILAGRETVPAQETTQETTQAVPEKETAVEQTTEQQTETETEQTAEGGKPPIGAIRQAERDKADKRYTAVLENLRQEISARDAAWEQRVAKMVEAQKPKAEPQPAPDFYENPPAAVLHTVEPHLQEFRSTLLHNSRLIAQQLHGQELVEAADAEFTKLYESRQLDPADYQRIIRSPNIYDAAVKWHKRRQALAEIGDDPVAYKAKLEADIRAQLEQAQGEVANGGEHQQQRSQVMPSNLAAARNVGARTGPAWAGPTPLNDIFKR